VLRLLPEPAHLVRHLVKTARHSAELTRGLIRQLKGKFKSISKNGEKFVLNVQFLENSLEKYDEKIIQKIRLYIFLSFFIINQTCGLLLQYKSEYNFHFWEFLFIIHPI